MGFDERGILRKAIKQGVFSVDFSNPVRGKGGYLMPIYSDWGSIIGSSCDRGEIAVGFDWLMSERGVSPSGICGIVSSGVPLATSVADYMKVSDLSWYDDSNKDHGAKRKLKGRIPREGEVPVIEDVITFGTSSAPAVKEVRKSGGHCSNVFSVFSYGLEEAGRNYSALDPHCNFESLCKFETFVSVAVEEGLITGEDGKGLDSWREDPRKWSRSHVELY